MRLLLASTFMLVLAACGTSPKPLEPVAPPAPTPERARGDLVGLDANALAARFGTPRLQVREGVGTKLQYARASCVLDFYLYPGVGGGAARVAHVDARNRDGRSVDPTSCIAMIEAR